MDFLRIKLENKYSNLKVKFFTEPINKLRKNKIMFFMQR